MNRQGRILAVDDLEETLGGASGSGAAAQVASYVQTLFGAERVGARTRIPTLATLAPDQRELLAR